MNTKIINVNNQIVISLPSDISDSLYSVINIDLFSLTAMPADQLDRLNA